MSIDRVAVIFDNTLRPDTTGTYCRRALGRLVDVEHFLPGELGRLRREKFDLYLAVDDGLNYSIPAGVHPLAYWAIDTHVDFEFRLRRARAADFVFAAQRDGADRLRQEGIATATWLPLGCDPEIHGRQPVAKEHDVCFVGNIFPGPREGLLKRIQAEFPKTFVGRRFFTEMARTYSASRIIFNRSLRNDVNMRVFEALASGSLLLTNDLLENGQDELFQDGKHLATYADERDLVE
jgi:spore maturation protein CgeB